MPQVGLKMGLSVMLDGHTDILEPYTIDSDFRSFEIVISSPGDFPLTFQKGFKIKSGHRNLVALSAIRIDADDTLRDIDPIDRGCLFGDETSSLVFHKRYSQANCFLECSLSVAQEKLKEVNNQNNSW